MPGEVSYTMTLDDVDWEEMKRTLLADNFDNERTPEQLGRSFRNSYASVIAYADGRIIGTARALSDGVCNAYVVDVWTLSTFRNRGVARTMMAMLEGELEGQHVYLFTEEAPDFYRKIGFRERGTGFGKVVGEWLHGKERGTIDEQT
jgi:predicted GNAT family acetyltransferase